MSLDAIGIASKDIEKSVEFYKILGVELTQVDSSEHLEGTTPSGIRIMVDSVELLKKINPDWNYSQGTGIVLCFKQETPHSVDQLHSQCVEHGFDSVKKPWDAFWGQRYASVKDPDGNQIDIFASL